MDTIWFCPDWIAPLSEHTRRYPARNPTHPSPHGSECRAASLAPLVRALSSLLGVGGGKEAVLEGPILLGRLVFAMELARLREHTLNARRRGRAAKELPCHLGKNRQAVLLTILSFPPGQHIQVDVFLDRQREVLIKLVFVRGPRALLERRLGGLLDVHRRHGQVKKGARRSLRSLLSQCLCGERGRGSRHTCGCRRRRRSNRLPVS